MRKLWVCLCLFLIATPASALLTPAVDLTPGRDAGNLKSAVRFTPLPPELEFDQVLSGLSRYELQVIPYADIEFGVPEGPVLVLLSVRNRGEQPGSWIFTTDRASLRRIELFQLTDGGPVVELAGDDIAAQKSQLRRYHAFAFEFSLQPGEERQLGVIFEAENSSRLPLRIQTAENHRELIDSQARILLVASTATLTLILINGLIFLLTRRKPFLYFVLAECALLYQTVHQHGYTTIYLFAEHSELGRVFAGYAKVLFAAFSVRFAREFLRIKQTFPSLDRVAFVFEVICWLVIAALSLYWLIPGLSLRTASYFSFAVGAGSVVFLPIIAVWAVYRQGNIYIPLVLSWGLFGAFIVYTTLASVNLVPGLADHWRWFGPVGALEAFFLSISLALDIRQIQNREIAAQSRLAQEYRQRLTVLETTREIAAERDLANRELTEAGQLVAAAGHDSRNLVGALKLYSRQIADSSSNEQSREYAARIETIVDHLDHTIELTMQTGLGVRAPGVICLETLSAPVLLDSMRLIYEQAAREKGLSLRQISCEAVFASDRRILSRLLSNLVSNAIKYSEGGSVLMTCRRRADRLRFQVWDQGRGIEADKLQDLLQPRHAGQRLAPSEEGLGTGLNIVHELAEKLGTRLIARSEPGSGSMFEFELPTMPSVRSPCRVAIVDDPVHWPEFVFRFLGDKVSYQFFRSIAEVPQERWDILIADPTYIAPASMAQVTMPCVIAAYDQSMRQASPELKRHEFALQKPVTQSALATLISLMTKSMPS